MHKSFCKALEKSKKYFLTVLIVINYLFLFSKLAFSDYSEAKLAYENNEWKKSLTICSNYAKEDYRCDNLIGVMLLEGLGTKKDIEKAFFYFSKASKKGSKAAYKNLAWMYAAGLGVKKNLGESSRLFSRSDKKFNIKKKELETGFVKKNLNEENRNIAIFRNYFSEYQKFQVLLKLYDSYEDNLVFNIKKINSNIKQLEDNIKLDNETKIKLKNDILEEQKILLKLFELSIKNSRVTLENELRKIYSNLENINF